MSTPQNVSNAEVVRVALQRLQAGELQQAEEDLRRVLVGDRDNLHANYFLGVIAHRLENFDAAAEYFEKALCIDPKHAQSRNGLGNVFREQGRLEQAADSYRQAALLRSDDARVHCKLSDVLVALGRLEDAETSYRKALSLQPEAAWIHNDLGVVLHRQGRVAEARSSFERTLSLDPTYIRAYSNLGNVLRESGRLNEAAAIYGKVLSMEPNFAEAYANLGLVLKDLGNLEAAKSCLEKAVTLKPDNAPFYNNLGVVLNELRCLEKAVFCLSKAVSLDPNYAPAHNNLGNILSEIGRFDEAIASYRKAIAIDPNFAQGYNDLGCALEKQSFLEEAAENYKKAVSLDPQSAVNHNNLGLVQRQMGHLHEAIACFSKAIDIKADYHNARWNLALTQLQVGRFREGWKNYESRWQRDDFGTPRQHFPQPLWDGSPLAGKTILLHCEQGFGDSIQFVRYVKNVAVFGGRIIVQCLKPLCTLFSVIPEIDELVAWGDEIPDFDTHAPFLSLPGILGTTLETIPAPIPYLHANGRYNDRVVNVPGQLKLGIVWSGNPRQDNDKNRSTDLEHFSRFVSIPGVSLYSLQVGERREDLEQMGSAADIVDLGGSFRDFADTAAAIARLDLVIGVDTAVTHLAGAMGKPVWVLLAFAPDWRWLWDRDDSPWYPTMRLYKQKRIGDWEGVFEKVQQELQNTLI